MNSALISKFTKLHTHYQNRMNSNMFISKVLQRAVSSQSSRLLCTEVENAVLIDKVGTITTIGINRPEKRNCVNFAAGKLLKDAIKNFEDDSTSPVAVLYGTGGNFCSGYDLGELSNLENASINIIEPTGIMGPTHRFIKKPIIAAVSGYAVAGGLELALMCDLRVVEETAVMGVFNRRFGVPLIDGGSVRLQALIGLSRALDMILTGRPVTGKEAYDWGLANRLVACGTALGQAINLANSIAKFPQKCLLADRLSTYRSTYGSKSIEDNFAFERTYGAKVVFEEAVPGAKKFIKGVGKHGKFSNLSERPRKEWESGDTEEADNDLKSKL